MARDKSRVTWLIEGDRNSAFFRSIRARRKPNHMTLQREDGTSTDNSSNIGNVVVEYYQKLFNKYTPPPSSDDFMVIFPSVMDEMNNRITMLPDMAEIREGS